MSALEPDGAAPHVFPHWREAVRSWKAWREGHGSSRAGLGDVRGKGPSMSDVLRVGQLLADLDLLGDDGELTGMGRQVVQCALDGGAGRGERKIKTAVERFVRHARKMRIIAPAMPRLATRRFSWRDDDGQIVNVTYIVDFS